MKKLNVGVEFSDAVVAIPDVIYVRVKSLREKYIERAVLKSSMRSTACAASNSTKTCTFIYQWNPESEPSPNMSVFLDSNEV